MWQTRARNSPIPFSAARLRLAQEAELAGISAWRVNDVVAYEAMRESATTLTALLLGVASSVDATAELAQLRSEVLGVDGYDRAAVVALATRISERILELSESAR